MYVYQNNCIPMIKPVSVALSGTTLQITLPALSLLNGKKWHLVICQSLPQGTEIGSVEFIVNGTTYPGVNGIGNELKTDMLKARKRFTIIYGWDVPHFMVCGTCESAFVPSTAVTPTPTNENAAISKKSTK